ncbi:hypothetical protein CAPTEDRAFT_218054 [Capitella teleta]|uniref:LRRCT domain-containing protein n=1 Tax=Capitella teleta TaxID=283909 RepID=R7U717_CAPTE|nr:hypothetical protein CAPTEDRAFT_218054 [Capitella teleta]|eukprot:ELT98925.1 hypothetical protein CAPTEDRAFT_218054 [Capitella teleta]
MYRLFFPFIFLSITWAFECPSDCTCDVDVSSINCLSANLTSIPTTGSYALLDVRHNNLTSLTLGSEHSSLEIVDASDNSIDHVSISFNLAKVHRIHLHRNAITSIERSLWVNVLVLDLLDLADNLISSVADETFADLEVLESLDLSGNQLRELRPRALSGLLSLRTLNLERNQLMSVPSLAHVPQLISLNLRHNQLVTLPTFSFGRQIQVLSVAHNQIVQITPSAFQSDESLIPQLTKLDMQHNQLQSFPAAALSCLRHLQVVDLSGNLFEELPAGSFNGVMFSRLHTVFLNGMPQLEVIKEGAFNALHSVRSLQINSCPQLSSIEPGAIANCPNLMQLDLHACALTNLTADVLSDWASMSSFDMRFNPIHCDCQLFWLKDRLSALSASSPSPKCASPESLHGRPLTQVPRSSMPCNSSSQVDEYFEDRIMIAIFTSTCLLLLIVGGSLMYKYRHSMCEQSQPGVDVYSYFVYHNPNRMARHHNIPPRKLQAKPRDPNRSLRHVTWSATDIEPYRPKSKSESQAPKPPSAGKTDTPTAV